MNLPEPMTERCGVRGMLYRVEFNSVAESIEVANAKGYGKNAAMLDRHIDKANESEFSSFFNSKTIEDIDSMLDDPPTELVDRVQRMTDRVRDSIEVPQKRRRKRRRGLDSGDELDPIKWAMRDPNGWEETQKIREPKHTLRIGVNLSSSAGARPHQLAARGAAAVGAADVLTETAHSVELVAIDTASNPFRGGSAQSMVVAHIPVKSAGDPLDIGSAAVVLGDISFFRLVVLCAEMRPINDKQIDDGFGTPAKVPWEDRRNLDLLIEHDVKTEESAIAVVNRAMTIG